MVTAGEILKNKRESLGKDLHTVSVDTKIQKRFIEYIEDDQYDKFDSEIFVTGFIKIYSKYLGLDVNKLLALYRRSKPQKRETPKKQITKKKLNFKPRISPKVIAISTLVIFLLLTIGYIGYQIYKFQTPPQLTITEPIDKFTTQEESVFVKGYTQSSATIEINGIQTDINSDGYFEKEIELNEGINSINVKAKKKSNTNLQITKTIKVVYTPKDITVSEPVAQENLLTLTILQSSSWIKLDIDSENKISEILQPNTIHEYTVLNTFSLTTGRIQSTQIQLNGKDIPIPSTNNTGVGQITCHIIQNTTECE